MTAREKLRDARKDAGLTQEALAKELGITMRHYVGIEIEDRMPSLKLATALEARFGIPASGWHE